MRALVIVVCCGLMVAIAIPGSAQWPAGTTNDVLSFIDASGGHVSVLRGWHGGGGADVKVFPFTPYFWDGCLPFQNGALMFLLTSPVGYAPPGLTSADAYTSQYLARLGQTAGSALAQAQVTLPVQEADARQNLDRLILGMTTPGDPAYEVLKTAAGQINSLSAYEEYGYAVLMFVQWQWIYIPFPVPAPCSRVTIQSIPEGYGIPIVTRRRSWDLRGAIRASQGKATASIRWLSAYREVSP